MRNLLIAIALVFFINASVVSLYRVASASMEDTLLVGDTFIMLNFWYGLRLPFMDEPVIPGFEPKADDILVFRAPLNTGEIYVKRCAAAGGQIVEVIEKRLYVDTNQVPLPPRGKNADPRVILAGSDIGGRRDFHPRTVVPDSAVFVLGDNRDFSADSRMWGVVPNGNLLGRLGIVLFSIDPEAAWIDIGHKIRWDRFFRRVK